MHRDRGDLAAALDHYQQALPIHREGGNRAGEAATRYNIAMILRATGRLAEAVNQLEMVVTLDTATQHPDLQADTEMLNQVRMQFSDQQTSDPSP